MTKNPTLVIGLGRTGGLVARELRALLPAEPDAASPRFLFFGSSPLDEGDLSPLQLDSGKPIEEVPLAMDLLRETMSGVREWVGYLPWLARYDESSYLDEIRPLGAAGYRSFARLATVRSDGLIDQALRRALAEVRSGSLSEHVNVILLAGAGGGLGSALLTDLTFLIQRHARKSIRTACLVLPPPGISGRSRFDANAFATLGEIATLKAMTFPYQIRFESLPPIDVRMLGDEAWQRVYCFEAEESEDIPFPTAARRVAEVLALQLEPRLGRLRRQLAQDFTSVLVAPGPRPPRLDKSFSTCGGLTLEFPKDVPGIYRDDPITPAILERATAVFVNAFDKGLLDLRDDPIYETRKGDQIRKHTALWNWEETLAQAVELDPIDPAALSKQPPSPMRLAPEALRKVTGLEAAFLSIHNDLTAPPPELPVPKPVAEPSGAKPLSGRAVFDELTSLRAASGAIWPQHEPADELRLEKKIRRKPFFSSLRRNMVWNLTERVATLQALVRIPEFQQAFVDALRSLAHEWLGYSPEVVTPDPSFEIWMAATEDRIHHAGPGIFSNAGPQGERRVFAIALLPQVVPPGFDRNVIRERLEHAVETALQVTPRIVDSPGAAIQIYFEDLFHSVCDVRRMPLYRTSYRAEPVKELFHTDYRFVGLQLGDSLCPDDEKAPLSCGNPDCHADLRLLPAAVRTCPSCGGPIRSRCGNPDCRVRDLHLSPDATARTCPGCGGFNHAAWWECCNHGKVGVFVPIDKERCPECLELHHQDPVLFPSSRISLRPDLRTRRSCWRCEDLQKTQPDHPVFHIAENLLPFVLNGVNGHDRLRFRGLARKYKLADDCKCPSCGTVLIPVDHRSQG